MRSKKLHAKKLSILLATGLIACFAIVFVATLFVSTNAQSVELLSVADAYLASATLDDAAGSVGTASSIYGNLGRATTATDFGFPGTAKDTTTWSYTESLTSIKPEPSTFQAYMDTKNSDDDRRLYIDGSAGTYIVGNTKAYQDRNIYSVINLKLGETDSFLSNIILNSMYSLSVTLSASIKVYCEDIGAIDSTYKSYLGISESSTGLEASATTSISFSSSSVSCSNSTSGPTTLTVSLSNVTKPTISIVTKNNYDQGGAYGKEVTTTITNIKLTYKISKSTSYTYSSSTSKKDGGDPIVSSSLDSLASTFVDGQKSAATAAGTGYAPYITSADSSTGWPLYDTDLKSELSKHLDSVANGTGSLNSYTNSTLGNDPSGTGYYKYSQVEYVDTYNYLFNNKSLSQLMDAEVVELDAASNNGVDDSSGSFASINKYSGAGDKYPVSIKSNVITWGTGNADYASGIKSVTVGDITIDVSTGSNAAKIVVDGVTVGYANVRKIDNGRVVVQIYVYQNTKITTMVNDYGNGVCSTSITFDGIDTTKPISTAVPSFSSDDDVIAYGADKLTKWVRTSKLTLTVDENFATDKDGIETDDGSPYVWFYTVKKNNSSASGIGEAKTFSSYSEIKAAGLRPISVTSFTEFVYNFEDGTASGISKGSQISGTIDSTDCTGSGYYRFTFYVCDLAGNLIEGSPVSFFVKVDYETPYSTTTVTTANGTAITNDNNGIWANCAETIKINLLKNNISGNTLQFETYDETYSLVFDSLNIISLNGVAASGNALKSVITGTYNSAEVEIKLESNNAGGSYITFSVPSSNLFAWDVTFTMYAGVDITEYQVTGPNIEEVDFDKASFTKDGKIVSGINFNSAIKIYIDNLSPNKPTTADYESVGYLKSVKDKTALTLNVTGTRTWFTQANMKMDSILTFEDAIIDTDFAQGLQVYYGVKTITSSSSFSSVTSFIDAYTNKDNPLSFDTDDYKAYFDRTQVYLGSGLTSGQSDISIDFIQKDGSNMRVLVLWAIDQAGNRTSDVSIYYVLADPTIYKLSSKLTENAIVGSTATLTLLNDDEVSSSTFSRGDTITLSYEFDDGYVPYQTKLVGTTTALLLSNYTSKIAWNIEDDYSSLIKQGASDENTITMTYLLDDPTKFSGLDSSMTFELAQRKVVGYTITNTSVRYTGLPTIIPMIFTDSRSENSFVYTFRKAGSSVNETTTPIIPNMDNNGKVLNYEVQVTIPIDDASFVVDKVEIVKNAKTGKYEQNVPFVTYTITKAIVTVKATATTSYYGELPSLSYTVDGLDSSILSKLTIVGDLKLNVIDVSPNAYNTLKVGSYAIIEGTAFAIDYCIVTFESNYHEILQKIIYVEIADNTKEYGDSDGSYKFWVNQTDSGLNVDALTTLLNCGNNIDNKYISSKYYYEYASSSYIARESGETVGAYKYINNPDAFILTNSNYAVSISKMGTFTITKKVIKIDATNQSYMFESVAEAEKKSNLEGLTINYSLGKFAQYSTIVSDLIENDKLNLGLDLTAMSTVIGAKVAGQTTDDFGYKYTYNVILTVAEDASENFTFALSESPTTMYIYSAKANTIIVKLKDSVRLKMVYGQQISTLAAKLKYDATTHDNFEVSGCSAEYGTNFNSIEWTAVINSATLSYPNVSTYTGYLNVGTYTITCNGAQMKMNEGSATITGDYTVVVIPIPIYVVPAVIEIEPMVEATNTAKTYSDSDSKYGIGVKIKSVNGIDAAKLDTYGNGSVKGLKDIINGSFARAIYDEKDNFVAFGSKNDSASNANGVVLGGTNYYSFAIYQEFSSSDTNGNYVIKATIDKTKRLVINPYTITVSVDDFKGISKVYDGTDDVVYNANNKAIDISLKLAVATDDVQVLFTAKYIPAEDTSAIPAAQKGHKLIKFTNIVLDGAKSLNYNLVINNSEGAIDLATGFTINYLAYKSSGKYDQTDWIMIKDGEINVLRSDFTVQKEYDNLTTLTNDDIKLVNRTDDDGSGTAMLYGAKSNMQITYGQFPDKEVSSNYSMDLELFFPLGIDTSEKIISTDTTITVESIEKDGVWGVRVYIQGMGAEITKRNLDYEDFESITADDRDYNATSAVTFSYTLKSSAVAAGDEALLKEQYITINGATKTGATSVGTYETTFTGYTISNSQFNARYSVDIASLNSNFIGSKKIDVEIDYAKLLPRVDFTSRDYNGSTNYSISYTDKYIASDPSSSMLKTLNYTEELIEELKQFTYTLTNAANAYKYALNGAANGDVQVDANGNVVLHNVMVSGLTITENGSANYLKNYIVYGGRYNLTTKSYEDVGAVESGKLIADYEMFNVAGLTKKNLQIFGNDIEVSNKVYDGTKNASITVKLDGSDAIEEDKQYLSVIATATYSRKQVGENINVTVKVSKLVLKDEKDTTHANLLNNYQLTAFTQKLQRSILARPVGFSVSIKDRVYNGTEAITKDLIKYDLSQMLGDDGNNYSVNTKNGAYYLTKDVNIQYYTKLDKDNDKYDSSATYYSWDSVNSKYVVNSNVKSAGDFNVACASAAGLYIYEITILDKEATAYNPILNNSKEKYINYKLSTVVELCNEKGVYNDVKSFTEFYAYQDINGNICYGTDCLNVTTASDTYKEGRNYYTLASGIYTLKADLNSDGFGAGYYYIDDDVRYLYYALSSTDKYITVENYNKLSAGTDKEAIDSSIVGYYIYNTSNVYVLDSNYSGGYSEVKTMTDSVSYVQGNGKVTQRQVSVTSVSILKSDNLTKYYDGTTKFYGVNGTDYEFDSSAIANDIASDHLTVENVKAQFKTSNAGLTQVEFTATGITTEKGKGYTDYSYNYSSKASSSTNKTATILKRTIYAYLEDATMVYGTALSNVNVSIKYYLDEACSKDNEVIVSDGKWLVKFTSFMSICGINYDDLEETYKEELKEKRYTQDANGVYKKDFNGDYYMLNDITYDKNNNIETNNITAPVKDIVVSGTRQNVGYVADRFGLKGGSATNFAFSYIYTKNGKNNYSELKVVKKTLYVVAEYKEYSREYGTDLDGTVKLNLLNESYKDGIVSGETSQDVYTGTLTVEFRKVSIADIKNIATAPAVTSISLINVSTSSNQGLDGAYYYVAYIVKSEDFSSQNYDLLFGSIYYDSSDNKFKYSFEKSSFSTQVPELEIVLPEISDVTLASDDSEVVYNKKEQASSLVKGLEDGDTVTIDGDIAKDVKIDAEGNVVAYEGDVVVTRTLIANENGLSYKITKNIGSAKLLVTKASAGLYANKQTVEYDKASHEVDDVYYGVTDTGSYASENSFTIKYYLNGVLIDTSIESLSEAGNYTYTVTFTSPSTNYKDETKSAEFVIAPAKINVILAADTRLTQEYVPGTNYSIKYSIEDVKGIGISLSDTELIFFKNGKQVEDDVFNESGRYQYKILLTSAKQNEYGSNVQMNNNTGYLDLTVSQIVSYNSDSKQVASLELKNQGDSLLVDTFTTRYLTSSNDLTEDDAYWASINQYMAAIEKAVGAGATLTSIVRMTLTYGLNTQSLSSKDAIVTVTLPENVDSSLSGYVVYQTTAEGTLVEVKSSDYTLENGTITYSTNYLGSLVFVKLGDEGLSTGAKVAIGVCVPAFILTVAGLVAVTLIKKKKLAAGL